MMMVKDNGEEAVNGDDAQAFGVVYTHDVVQ